MMISLPVCRWRDSSVVGPTCRSTKFVHSPNRVSEAFCARCHCVDHDPEPPQPPVLPCVHLEGPTEGGVFACALHGACVPGGSDAKASGAVRHCSQCPDYLAREPFGASSTAMRQRADSFLAALPHYPARRYRGRGVVIAGGGDRYFPSLYVTIRALRHVGCTLPIQVWYLGRNDEMPDDRKALLDPLGVECIDADEVRRRRPARNLNGWELKVFATLHSTFEEVLFLDADCYPCRNPEFLFDVEEYRAAGAVFWPECMPIDTRLKWSAFGVADPQQASSVESGQYLLHKRLSWKSLNLAWFYNDYSDYYYRYCYGDKHTFEAAWARLGQAFVMFEPVARVEQAGYRHIGPDRQLLFVHRCSDKFRLNSQQFATPQRNVLPCFYPSLPLEKECWGWLGELARAVGVPVRSPDGAVRKQVATAASNIAVATLYTTEIAAYGELTAQVLRQYAGRHGYRAITHAFALDMDRPPSWSKIRLIERTFACDPCCEWLMWVDADALIVQHHVPLTRFLDDDADLIGGDDAPSELFNTGVFFVRNCAGVAELLRRAYAKTQYIHHHWWETLAIMDVIREGVPGLRVKIVPRQAFNAYAPEYCDGDFAIHFAGRPHGERVLEIGRLAAAVLAAPAPPSAIGVSLCADDGPAIRQPVPSLSAEFLSEWIVYDAPLLRKVRLGSRHDGGYVVPDLQLEKVDFLYSVGVGDNLDFEHEFRARGHAKIKLFDPTIAKPDCLPAEAEFFPVGLGVHSHSIDALFEYAKRPDSSGQRLWLKMDIEGWEWDALALTTPECLEVFEVLVVEFHWLTDVSESSLSKKIGCIKKLNRSFRLIHAHGNNYASHQSIPGTTLPDCLEATFLRADLMPTGWTRNRQPLPGWLDSPCNPLVPDLDLNCWPFRDDNAAFMFWNHPD